ncbi:MAG: triose-phosphate isomerase [Candidatus Aenigmatarchaeota archaeon]
MIVLNFKNYKEALGKNAIKICKIVEEVYRKSKVEIFVAPQYTDIPLISKKFSFPILAQHFDDVEEGKFTGSISILSLKEYGVTGSLLNHYEKKLNIEKIKNCIKLAKKHNFRVFVLSSSLNEAKKIIPLKPYSLAYEPPELIGTGKAVSREKPEILKKFTDMLKGSKIIKLAGAGISDENDVRKALVLGCDGVLIASAFVFSQNKKEFLIKILDAFNEV